MTFNFWVNTTNSLTKHKYNSTITNMNNITTTNTTYRPGLGHYNISGFPTLPPPVPIFMPTVVVSNDSSFYSYGYYYLILLAFLILAGVLVKLAAQRRQQAVRAALSQRLQARQANASVSTISNERMRSNVEPGNDTQPKDSDLPPAYDEVMQTYINAKLELQAQEEAGAVGGMSSAISSITIETEVDALASSADLTTAAATTTTIATVASTQPPPTYASTELKNNSSSIA